ncbi:retrovirus-related pol polyprotein from transposon TNT 1-94 [Tanacetum coccineum]
MKLRPFDMHCTIVKPGGDVNPNRSIHNILAYTRSALLMNSLKFDWIKRGELLTAIGRDANNQMYPIAWAVVKVENNENWCWFLSLLQEDLELGHETGITVISNSHKCTRHVFAGFKKKFSGVQLQRLFWLAAGTTVESIFYNNMDQIKAILPDAYDYLNHTIYQKEIRGYERATKTVVPSGFQELEVRKGEESFGVNLHLKKCICKLWELSVYSSNMWKRQPNQPLLPPIVKGMSGRPKKNIVNARGDASGDRGKASGGIGEASGGIGEASGGRVQASDGRGQSNAARFQANTEIVESSGERGRARGKGGRSGRGRGRGGRGQDISGRGRGRGGTKMLVDEQEMSEDEIKKNMEHEYMEQARYEKLDQERSIEEEDFEYNEQWYNHILTLEKSASTRVEDDTTYVQTQESVANRGELSWRLNEDAPADPSVAANETTPKGKTIESNAAKPPNLKKQGRKRKVAEPSAVEPPFRIYHKNRGRSKRIFNQKIKKTSFGPNGEGSTADKAFLL